MNTDGSIEVILIEILRECSRIESQVLFVATSDHRCAKLNEIGGDAGWIDLHEGGHRRE